MITKQDLQAAIAECEGQRNPNANTCLKLAAYYTIQDKMFGENNRPVISRIVPEESYSFSSEPESKIDKVTYLSDTEFSKAVNGKKQEDVFIVIDELMSVLQAVNPKLYNGVMRKLDS